MATDQPKGHAQELGVGLVGATAAEAAAVSESAKKYRNLKAKGFHVAPEEMGAIARRIGPKNAAIAGLGLQGTNMVVGASAAHHLLKKPKGSAMKSGQTAIHKAEGAVSRNGHGKKMDSKLPAAMATSGGVYGAAMGGYFGHAFGDRGLENAYEAYGLREARAEKPKRDGVKGLTKTSREYKKMMRANGLMAQPKSLAQHGKDAKHFAGKNTWAIAGATGLGTVSALGSYAEGKKAVNKADRGKALDATGAVAAGVGGAGLYQAGKMNTKAKRATASAEKYGERFLDYKNQESKKLRDAAKQYNKSVANGVIKPSIHHTAAGSVGFVHDPETLRHMGWAQSHAEQASREYDKSKKMEGIAQKLKSGRNKYALGGAALIGAAGAERVYNNKKVNKAVGANSLVMIQNRKNKKKLEAAGTPVEKSKAAERREHKTNAAIAGVGGSALLYNAANKTSASKTASSLGSDYYAKKIARGRNLGVAAGSGFLAIAANEANKAHKLKTPVKKAYRRFDPEADRQRRLGLYSGAAAGSGIVLGREAARNYKVSGLDSASRAEHGLGVKLKPGLTKRGLGLTAATLAAGAISAGSYKRGVSARNQPWT